MRHLGGDTDHRTDLRHRARLEGDVADPGIDQLLDQRHGILELGDPGRDGHAVDRRPTGASALHQPLATDLHLPEVGVEEQRVELRGAARFQQFGELGQSIGEHLLGHLAATGELGPVPGVGRRRHDGGVDGRGGHAGQQDRRSAGESGEGGLDAERAVGQPDRDRTAAGPRRLDRRLGAGSEEVAPTTPGGCRHHTDAAATGNPGGHAGEQVTRAEVQDPAGTGGDDLIDLIDPVHGIDQHRPDQGLSGRDVETALRSPGSDQFDRAGHGGVVERHFDGNRFEHRMEDRATTTSGVAIGAFGRSDLVASSAQPVELGRRAAHHHPASPVADRQHRSERSPAELGHHLGESGGIDIGDRDHGRLVSDRDHATATGGQRARRTDELRGREQRRVGSSVRGDGRRGQHALGVARHGRRWGHRQVEALHRQDAQRGELGEQHPRTRDRRRAQLGRRRRRVRVDPAQWFETGRTYDHQVAFDGSEQRRGLGHDRLDVCAEAAIADELGQRVQPGSPLATEHQTERFALGEPTGQRSGRADRGAGRRTNRRSVGARPAVGGSIRAVRF